MTNWRTIKVSKTRFYMKPHQENVQLINVKDLYHKTIMALSYCKQQYKHCLKVYLEKQYHFKAKNEYLHVIISLEENLTVQKMKLSVNYQYLHDMYFNLNLHPVQTNSSITLNFIIIIQNYGFIFLSA